MYFIIYFQFKALEGSLILSSDEADALYQMSMFSDAELLYRATRDGGLILNIKNTIIHLYI